MASLACATKPSSRQARTIRRSGAGSAAISAARATLGAALPPLVQPLRLRRARERSRERGAAGFGEAHRDRCAGRPPIDARAGADRWQRLCENAPERLLVIAADESRKVEHVRRQRRNLRKHLANGMQPIRGDLGRRADVDHNTGQRAARETDSNHRPRRCGDARGNPVVECAVRRHGQRNARNGHCRRSNEIGRNDIL